jgi:hypothetical protein
MEGRVTTQQTRQVCIKEQGKAKQSCSMVEVGSSLLVIALLFALQVCIPFVQQITVSLYERELSFA